MYIDDLIIYCNEQHFDLVLELVATFLGICGLKLANDKTNFVKTFSSPQNALGYLYSIYGHGQSIHITLTQPKHLEVLAMLTSARSQLATHSLQYDLIERLVGNLTWCSQLERFSCLRLLSNFTSKWTVRRFFDRAVKSAPLRKNFLKILTVIESILINSPPQCTIKSDDYDRGITHFFTDASLANNIAIFGAFFCVEKLGLGQVAEQMQFPPNQWFYYAKTLDISGCNQADIDVLKIDIFETLALSCLTYFGELFSNRYTCFNIDNSTSMYAMVKLQPGGENTVRVDTTLAFLQRLLSLTARPVVEYIPSNKNIGDACTREWEFFISAIKALKAVEATLPDFEISTLLTRTAKADVPSTKTRKV